MRRFKKSPVLGFTMVELSLAMAFVSVLMLTIATTVIQIGNIYSRGMNLKAVEQAGRQVAADIRRSISQANELSWDNPANCIYLLKNTTKPCFEVDDNLTTVKQDYDPNVSNAIQGGRLCTGTFTYVWNYGGALNKSERNINKYADPTTTEKIRLVKVKDSSAAYCRTNAGGSLAAISSDNVTELLSNNDINLTIHRLIVKRVLSANNQALYNFNIRIGTNDSDYIQTAGDCKNDKTAQIYCSVNEFEFSALNDIMR